MSCNPDVIKLILVSREKCNGCRRCELVCSLKHFGLFAPAYSRIRVLKINNSYLPSLCGACEDAPCIKVCPVNARLRLENQAVDTDDDRCIGCRACGYVCPFMAPVISPATNKSITCDLCFDDPAGPWCVAACREAGALQFVPMRTAARSRANFGAQFWKKVINRTRGNCLRGQYL